MLLKWLVQLTCSGALENLRGAQESSVKNYISSIISKELEQQDLLDDNSLMCREAAKVVDLCKSEFHAYCTLHDVTIDLTDELESESTRFFIDIYPPEGATPIEWSQAYKVMCIETAALVHYSGVYK